MVPEQYRRKLSKDEINALPLRHYEGEIRLVRTQEELEEAVALLLQEKIIGFDTETKPTFRKGKLNAPSLVQCAGANIVFLFQLQWVAMGPEIASLLEAPHIIKAGVSVREDVHDLQKMFAFNPANLVDLAEVARMFKLETFGLRNLAANFFQWRISKGPQCSNWSQPNLSARQVAYAATDAWIGREVCLKMCELGLIRRV